jgi:acyl-CoA thioester hydrolase
VMDFYSYSRRIHYYETDAMAIVHHSNHLRLFEEARVGWFRARGMDQIAWIEEKQFFPLIDSGVKYLKPIYFDDEIKVKVQVKLERRRFTFQYAIYILSEGTDSRARGHSRSRGEMPLLCATGGTTHALIDKEFNIVRDINPKILSIMEAEPWTETWP